MSKAIRHDQQALKDAISGVQHAGTLMSNICFNLKQDKTIPERHRTSMDEAQRKWDAAANRLDGQMKNI